MASAFISSELISLVERMSRDDITLAVAWLVMGTVSRIHSERTEEKDEHIRREHSLWQGKGSEHLHNCKQSGCDYYSDWHNERKIRYDRKGTLRAKSHLSTTPGCKLERLTLGKSAACGLF